MGLAFVRAATTKAGREQGGGVRVGRRPGVTMAMFTDTVTANRSVSQERISRSSTCLAPARLLNQRSALNHEVFWTTLPAPPGACGGSLGTRGQKGVCMQLRPSTIAMRIALGLA